jgi:serine/threonine-protein kinase RsbW
MVWRSLTVVLCSEMSASVLAAALLRALCARTTISPDAVNEVELGLVEAMNNIVEHSYGFDAAGRIGLTFAIDPDGSTLTLTLEDNGRPLPEGLLEGAALPVIDPDDRDGLPERGMGLALVKMTMDRIEYRGNDRCNTLTMVKMVSRTPATADEASTA